MPSTIKIKRSSVAGKKPTTSDISTGELAINTKDFKLFSSNGTAVFELGNAGALANTNARINLINTNLTGTNTALRTLINARLQVSNAATLYATKSNPTTSGVLAHTGRATISTNLTVSGNTLVSGTLSTSNFTAKQVGGDEGGQIEFELPATNTTLSGGVAIDIYQNKLRIFEKGGTARGAYIDLTAATAGAGSNLLSGGSGGTVTVTKTTVKDLTQNDQVVTNATLSGIGTVVDNSIVQQTNTALRTLISARMQVANVNTLVAARATWAGLTGTNTALRTLISDRLQVANASTLYATKSNPTTSGVLAHTGRATISTNLVVSGNTTINGTTTDRSNALSQTLTDGVTVSWDVSLGRVATVTLAGNRTMAAPTNLKVGTYILHVIQDATGSRTLTWNSIFKWTAGVAPVLTITANARDVFSFVSDGTNLYGSYLPDMK